MNDVELDVDRTKNITFSVHEILSKETYVNVVTVTVASILAFYIIFLTSLFICERRCYNPKTMDYINNSEAGRSANPNGEIIIFLLSLPRDRLYLHRNNKQLNFSKVVGKIKSERVTMLSSLPLNS